MKDVYNNEGNLIKFTENILEKITATPGDFGTTADRAAEYGTTRGRFMEACSLINNESTRISSNYELKSAARTSLVNSTRALVREFQAWPMMTDVKRRELQIAVRDTSQTPVPPPTDKPLIELVTAVRYTVRTRVKSTATTRRRPAGVAGAQVFYAVGPDIPLATEDWRSSGLWTRGTFDVTFPTDTPAGATVWITAAYYNGKGQYGPMADAVSTNLPGGQAARRAA